MMALIPKQLLREADVLFLRQFGRSMSSKIVRTQVPTGAARRGFTENAGLSTWPVCMRSRCFCPVQIPKRATVRHSFTTAATDATTASSAACSRQLSPDIDDNIPWFLDKPLETAEDLSSSELEVEHGTQVEKVAAEDSGVVKEDKTPSRKKNILTGRILPRVHKLTKKQLLGRIQNRGIIYDDGHIVAINKLVGLPVQAQSAEEVSLNAILPDLGAALKAPSLSIVKPLDWHLSGIVLLARTSEARAELLNCIKSARQRNIFYRKYWGVVIGALDPPEGEIKCHLTQQKIGDHTMTVPVLNPTKGEVRRKEARNCLTRYKVISQGQGYALVQLEPMQMFVDQLQVHLTTRLCSVLGDHVYSSRVGSVAGMPALMDPAKVGPRTQHVPKDILKKMNLRAILMHKVPVHLHCGEMVLPGFRGQDVTITAPLPRHFQWTLKLLGLEDPTQKP